MKEILEAIDNIKLECPEFTNVFVEISTDIENNSYFLRTSAYLTEIEQSFNIRVPFAKMKDALKALEDCKLETIREYNNLDFL